MRDVEGRYKSAQACSLPVQQFRGSKAASVAGWAKQQEGPEERSPSLWSTPCRRLQWRRSLCPHQEWAAASPNLRTLTCGRLHCELRRLLSRVGGCIAAAAVRESELSASDARMGAQRNLPDRARAAEVEMWVGKRRPRADGLSGKMRQRPLRGCLWDP